MRRQRLHQLLPEREERVLMQTRRAVTPEPIVVHHTLSESMKAGPYLVFLSRFVLVLLLVLATKCLRIFLLDPKRMCMF